MNSAELKRRVTPEEYLVAERRAEWKSELVGGVVREMSHPSRWHLLIAGNISRALHNQLQGRNADVFQSAMRIKVNATGLYTYPDVSVVYDESKLEDHQCDTLLNPTLLEEVLSESTAGYDRGAKFVHYRQIDSLREYLIVAQDKPQVELFAWQANQSWLLRETNDLNAVVPLTAIGCGRS